MATGLATVYLAMLQIFGETGRGRMWPSWYVAIPVGLFLVVVLLTVPPLRNRRSITLPQGPLARVQVKDSPGWEWEDTTVEDNGRPFVDARDSPDWRWRRTSFQRDDRTERRSRRRRFGRGG